MPEKHIKDIMIPLEQYSRVEPNESIASAVRKLLNSYRDSGLNYRTVLVVSGTELVGLLTMRNLLSALDPALFEEKYMEKNFWIESYSHVAEPFMVEGLFKERCRENCKKKVKDVMQHLELITVYQEDTILKAIHLMVKNHINLLPVMDGNDKLVGTIRIVEIVEEIEKLFENMPECQI
ncbi:MAG: CBS domain-containing protein [Firmicutes bacterium]|nr:CBS domain-containing protein [Bacillota bacterium]